MNRLKIFCIILGSLGTIAGILAGNTAGTIWAFAYTISVLNQQ